MNSQQIQSLVRAVLVMFGTYLVNKGITDTATWTTVTGFLVGIVPLVWSYFRHAQPPGSSPSSPSTAAGVILPFVAGAALLGLTCGTVKAQSSIVTNTAAGTYTVTTTNAQGNVTSVTTPIAATGVWGDLELAGAAILPNIEAMAPFTTNGIYIVQFGVGMNTATKNWIEGLALNVPMTTNVSIGLVGSHIGSTWRTGGGDVTLGTTKTEPVVGTIHMFAGDGALYNMKAHAFANYVITGGDKTWDICSWLHINIGLVIANTSDLPGVDIMPMGGFTITPGKW
jgi:hypothetical protein